MAAVFEHHVAGGRVELPHLVQARDILVSFAQGDHVVVAPLVRAGQVLDQALVALSPIGDKASNR